MSITESDNCKSGSVLDSLGSSVKELLGDYAPSTGQAATSAGAGALAAIMSAILNSKEKPRKGETRAERRSRITRNALFSGLAGAGGTYAIQKGLLDDETGLLRQLVPSMEEGGLGSDLLNIVKSTLDPTKLDERVILGGATGGATYGAAALADKYKNEFKALSNSVPSGEKGKGALNTLKKLLGDSGQSLARFKGTKLPVAIGLASAFLPEIGSTIGTGLGAGTSLVGGAVDRLTTPTR